MKAVVKISPSFPYLPEIKYAIELLFEEILGLELVYTDTLDINDSVEILTGDVLLRFKHSFFSLKEIYNLDIEKFKPSLREYKIASLNRSTYNFRSTETIITLDVNTGVVANSYFDIHDKVFETDLDVLGATFFLATRFEEWINPKRDKHGRFAFKDSVLHPGFISRPIINEYAQFVFEVVSLISPELAKQFLQKNKYEVSPTHDVDFPYLYRLQQVNKSAKEIYASYLKKGIRGMAKYIGEGIGATIGITKDPYDYNLELMKIDTSFGHKSVFNFMCGLERGGYNSYYRLSDVKIKKMIAEIISSGNSVGFHPSYNTVHDYKLFKAERDLLRSIVNKIDASYSLTEGRQHYLRFDINSTFDYWNDSGMKIDSTLGFAEQPGFRSGICTVYSTFSLPKRKKLSLKEKPLVIMDVTITRKNYLNISLSDAFDIVESHKQKVKKHNGVFTVLFHNDWFYFDLQQRMDLYKQVLK